MNRCPMITESAVSPNNVYALFLRFLPLFILGIYLTSTLSAANLHEEYIADMPVKEVTIFKDGHAFVLHQGKMPTDPNGNVVLDYLPRPIIGTFWAYSADDDVALTSVVAGEKIVSFEKTALSIPELIRANVGKKVLIKESHKQDAYEAVILDIPTPSPDELESTTTSGRITILPKSSDVVSLKVPEGFRLINISQIQNVTFLEEPADKTTTEEFRDTLTLKLDWPGQKSKPTAEVGMTYVQKGIRWIPSYRVEIDGQGKAHIKLQATILNELIDIEDVTAHLVIGVPSFAFKDIIDPISLQKTAAQLSSHFRSDSQTAYGFSNSIMAQTRSRRTEWSGQGRPIDSDPEVIGSGANEDLYVFTVDHITLKKGERMVVPVTEFTLSYNDVFILDLPFAPPPEVGHNFNSEQQAALARLFASPKVKHKIRLANDSEYPLTTAPALILRDGLLIAQGMTKYTAVGSSSDLELTDAVDVSVSTTDVEIEYVPNAEKWNSYTYARNDLNGKINIVNHRDKTLTLEITRSVLGKITAAGNDGKIEHLGRHRAPWTLAENAPFWWRWHNWPYWWYHFNSIARVTWECELESSESIDLEYNWSYYWRW